MTRTAQSDTSPLPDLPWPVVDMHPVILGSAQRRKVDSLAAQLLRETPQLQETWFCDQGVTSGMYHRPTVYVEDHRPVALMTDAKAKPFEYRMFGLASTDDIYLVSEPCDPGFLQDLSDRLGTERPNILRVPRHASRPLNRIAETARRTPAIINALVARARISGGMNFVPYISSGDVWALAADVAKCSGTSCSVCGAPPALSHLANNKLWFATLVSQLLGRDAVPPTQAAYNISTIVRIIRSVLPRGCRLVVKVPDSAGGLGNLSIDASVFEGRSARQIGRIMKDHLAILGWRPGDALLVGEWETNVIESPSAQIWVPHSAEGRPVIEGLFVQALSGDRAAFVGAARAHLPGPVESQMATEALMIATVLQSLGYFGRLSLDAVLIGASEHAPKLHWIEANARWGGVSIPMTISNRLQGRPLPLLIVQHSQNAFSQRHSEDRLQLIDPSRYSATSGRREGALFLLPPDGKQILYIIVGQEAGDARRTSREIEKVWSSALSFDPGQAGSALDL